MPQIDRYWLDDKSVPFGTFLRYMEKYYHPEIRNDNYDALVARARLSDPGDVGLATFKSELGSLLKGNREGIHRLAIVTAAGYDDWDTDDEFLAWLWYELFPSEPVPTSAVAESD
ncbi:hypothetical protein F1D05_09875 [Kribbella qitaiheensis]|uniref:CdiI immunity protein domain-containing protein n=1 Tax=Kribbella qitaiheensis TaxID=1544730 RepID=A0A7G6WVX6_9ACTN|nr:hypothetical protein [Kribbella qitaiheensis]QNE18141.1 hypothetical protein F1D05_09875 [Kribbella qitaiheensis]